MLQTIFLAFQRCTIVYIWGEIKIVLNSSCDVERSLAIFVIYLFQTGL